MSRLVMLKVTIKLIILIVVMQCVVILNVLAPFKFFNSFQSFQKTFFLAINTVLFVEGWRICHCQTNFAQYFATKKKVLLLLRGLRMGPIS